MSKILRWKFKLSSKDGIAFSSAVEDTRGDWVYYNDHLAAVSVLEEKIDELKRQINTIQTAALTGQLPPKKFKSRIKPKKRFSND